MAAAQLQPTQLTISAATTVRPFSGFPVTGIRGSSPNMIKMWVAGVSSRNQSRALCERQGAVRETTTSTVLPADQDPAVTLEKKHEDHQAAAEEKDFPAFEFDIKKRTAAEDQGVEFFVEEYGWKVRRMVEEGSEIRKVANVQAKAFHEPAAIFNDWFFYLFQAEVLSGLLYRLRNSPPNRYACLVAEPAITELEQQDDMDRNRTKSELVGVVDLMVLKDSDVVQHLNGAKQYLYVSGIAVSSNHRRKKVATALLKACEAVSNLWGYEYLALRAYEDDWGARALYTNAGYEVVARDPPWIAWIGRKRRRILMIKRSSSSLSSDDDGVDDNKNRLALPAPKD